MKKSFLAALLLFSFLSYGQIDAGEDILMCEIEPVELSVDYAPNSVGTNEYLLESIPYTNESFTGTEITLSDDSEGGPYPIGFEFCFYGNNYTEFCIGSNGWITFSCGQPVTYVSGPIPDLSSPLNTIMGPWSDWNPATGGQIKYETIGTAPNRALVVSWINVPLYACDGFIGKFQIVLRESTNIIENNIETKDNCPNSGAGGSNIAVQGIQNIDGTASVVVPGRNATGWEATDDSHRYTPSGDATSIIEWFDDLGNSVGNGVELTVTPTTTTTYTVVAQECPTSSSDEVTIFVSSPVEANAVIDDIICPEEIYGSIEISPTGGINPLTFNWTSNSAFTSTDEDIYNIEPGQYNLTITDNLDCETQAGPFTISAPPPPITAVDAISNVTCFGFSDGAVSITVSGGTPGYNYGWISTNPISGNGTNSITNLATGNYTANVTDANGCAFIRSYYVDENSPLNINTTQSDYNGFNIRCNSGNDGWIDLEISGGETPYTYEWIDVNLENTISNTQDIYNITAGQYQLNLIDAKDCPESLLFDITEPDSVRININDYEHKSCTYNDDGFIKINTWGGPDSPVGSEDYFPYKYNWEGPNYYFSFNKNIYDLSEGIYTVVVEDINNCSNDFSFEIKQNEEITADYRITDDTITINYPIVNIFDNSSGKVNSWNWEFSNGLSYTSEDIIGLNLSLDLSEIGKMYYDLKLIVTDAYGCTDTTTGTIGIKDEHTLYVPNAFTPDLDGINDSFRIFHHAMNTETFVINIFDRNGSLIYKSNDPDAEWDGRNQFTGNKIMTGSYSYSLSYVDFEGRLYDYTNCENCSGTISIIR